MYDERKKNNNKRVDKKGNSINWYTIFQRINLGYFCTSKSNNPRHEIFSPIIYFLNCWCR